MPTVTFTGVSRHVFDETHAATQQAYARVFANDALDGRAMLELIGSEGLFDSNGGIEGRIIAAEASGFAGGTAPLLGNHAVLDLLARLGVAEQLSTWTQRLMSGEIAAALALLETGATADVRAMAATATPIGDSYMLNGVKIALVDADLATTFLVVAKAGDEFIFAFVKSSAEGVMVRPLVAEAPVQEVNLHNVVVAKDAVLGSGPVSAAEADRALALLQLDQSARAAARLEYAFAVTIEGAKSHQAGDKPILKNQATQFKLADARADLMIARAFVDASITKTISEDFTPLDAAMLKLFVSEAEEKVFDALEQVLGAVAYSEAVPIARMHAGARGEQLASCLRDALRKRIFTDGVANDRSDSFDILTVGRDESVLTEDYRLYRQSVRRFLQKEVEPYCKSWIESGDIPKDIWRKAAENGLLGVRIPAEAGGGGGDALFYILMSEELGRSSSGPIVGPLFQSDGLSDLIIDFGTEQQKETWYPRFLAGEVPAFAVSEPQSGSDVRAFRTTAVKDGDDYIINGQKLWTTFATHADFFLVLAKTDPNDAGHMGFFIVDAKTPGLEPRRLKTRTYACGDTCELFLTDVRVHASALIGEVEGQALEMTKKLLGLDRIQVGARSLGSADLAYRETLDFVATRRVFGRNLIDFENTQALLAQVRTELHAGRAYIDYAFQRHARGTLDFASASIAKLWLPTFEFRTVDRLMQMFGGNGFVSEYTIAHQLGGARANRILGGTDEMMRQTISYAF